jgi:MFS family permease
MASVTARSASVFRSSSFTRFYAGQSLSYLGDGLRTLAIPLIVYKLTGSGVALGVTWGLELVPYAFVSLIGGSLADRVDRRRLMLACDALRCVVMLALSALFALGRLALWEVYVGVFVLACAGAIFLGAQQTSIPYLLGKARVKSAVAALNATEQSVNLVAPPLGGALLSIVGPLPALLANAVTYLASQLAIASVPDFGPETPGRLPTPREIAGDVLTGWRFLRGERALFVFSLLSLALNFVGSIGFIAIIPFVKRAFGATDWDVGVAFGCFAGGAALGALVAARTSWRFGPAYVLATLLDGLAWLPIAWAPSLPLAIVGITISSACSGYTITNVVSWRLRIIPDELVGRVFGVVKVLVLGGIFPGSLLGGWLADHLGVRQTEALSGCAFLAVALVALALPVVRAEGR